MRARAPSVFSPGTAERRCQRMVDVEGSRDQCNFASTWAGYLHVGRQLYYVTACEWHAAGLVDAEPIIVAAGAEHALAPES